MKDRVLTCSDTGEGTILKVDIISVTQGGNQGRKVLRGSRKSTSSNCIESLRNNCLYLFRSVYRGLILLVTTIKLEYQLKILSENVFFPVR